MQDQYEDQNRILSEHKDTSQFMRSPLTNKSQNDQRFFFTDAKVPFKNSTNNECNGALSHYTGSK